MEMSKELRMRLGITPKEPLTLEQADQLIEYILKADLSQNSNIPDSYKKTLKTIREELKEFAIPAVLNAKFHYQESKAKGIVLTDGAFLESLLTFAKNEVVSLAMLTSLTALIINEQRNKDSKQPVYVAINPDIPCPPSAQAPSIADRALYTAVIKEVGSGLGLSFNPADINEALNKFAPLKMAAKSHVDATRPSASEAGIFANS